MLTFKGKTRLKEKLVRRAEAHAEADRFQRGYGYFRCEGDDGYSTLSFADPSDPDECPVEEVKGCAIGCLATPVQRRFWKRFSGASEPTERLEKDFGLPAPLTAIAEAIFEDLPTSDSNSWPVEFVNAVPVGVEIDPDSFARFLRRSTVLDPETRAENYLDPNDDWIETPEEFADYLREGNYHEPKKARVSLLRYLRNLA